ncbi:hypothetical protein ABBQ38_008170 [Trebouxia sp. C0009 RCD-2024]
MSACVYTLCARGTQPFFPGNWCVKAGRDQPVQVPYQFCEEQPPQVQHVGPNISLLYPSLQQQWHVAALG